MTDPASRARQGEPRPGSSGPAGPGPAPRAPPRGDAPPHEAPAGFRGQRFLLVLSVILVTAAALVVRQYLAVVVFSLIFGYLLHPVFEAIKRRVRSPDAASGIVLLLVAIAIVIPVGVVGYFLVQEASALTERLEDPEGVEAQVVDAAERFGLQPEHVAPMVTRAVEALAGYVAQVIVPAVTIAVEFVIALVVFFILLYFVLRDGDQLVAYVRRTMPLDATRRDRLLDRTGDQVKGIILGTFVVGILQGVAAALGWAVLGFPSPVLWGAVLTLFAVLPFLGPFMILLPAGAIAILQGNLFAGIGIIAWALLLIGVLDDILRPYVIGKRTHVHPAIILVGILGGVYVFGVTGIVLGPLVLSLLGVVFEAWARPEDEAFEPPGEEEDSDDEGNGSEGEADRAG